MRTTNLRHIIEYIMWEEGMPFDTSTRGYDSGSISHIITSRDSGDIRNFLSNLKSKFYFYSDDIDVELELSRIIFKMSYPDDKIPKISYMENVDTLPNIRSFLIKVDIVQFEITFQKTKHGRWLIISANAM